MEKLRNRRKSIFSAMTGAWVAMMTAMMLISAPMWSQVTFDLNPSTLTLGPTQSTFSVTVEVNGPTDGSADHQAVELSLEFDPSILQVVGNVTSGSGSPLVLVIPPPPDNVGGSVGFVASAFTDVSPGYDLCIINFEVVGSASNTSISFNTEPDANSVISTVDLNVNILDLPGSTELDITFSNPNTAPFFTNSIGNQTNNEGDVVAGVDADADDAETPGGLTYSATGLPPGLNISTSTGAITGTISSGASSGSPYNVSVSVTDGELFASPDLNFTWTVNAPAPVDTEPVITLDATATVNEGGGLSVPLSISDADGDNLTVTISSVSDEPQLLQTNNSGIQVDPYPTSADGFLTESGVSAAAGSYSSSLDFSPIFGDGGGANGDGSGSYTVTVQVQDEDGNTITQDLALTVNDAPQPISATGTTRIEAESFDNQGPPNTGSGNNGIGVEIQTSAPIAGVTNIGFTHNGEFVEYDIDVASAGTYTFDFLVSKGSGGTATMTVNGGPASIDVTNQGGWAAYYNVSTDVVLSAGPQTLRFDWTAGSGFLFNIDYVDISPVVDETPPVITLNGNNPESVVVGTPYADAGATASDDIDGDITGNIVVGGDVVDVNTIGSYVITYNVSDAAGNAATEVTRTVNVIAAPDTDPPVITLLGANPQELFLGGTYVELGAMANDVVDGDISANIVIDASAVDMNTVGSYPVTYNVADAAGNDATEVVRTVDVLDGTPPVITLDGDNPQNILLGDPYVELGASATDNVDGDISGNIVIDASAVDVNTVGLYNVTYNVNDAAGNPATEVVRVVNVFDNNIELPLNCDNVLFRVNIGGPQVAAEAGDIDQTPWGQDQGNFGNANNSPYLAANTGGGSIFNGGSGSAHAGAINTSDPSVPANFPVAIFNTERYDLPSAPEQRWEFPVPPGSEVQVTILFAELFGQVDQAGERVFDVAIEGVVLPQLDDIDQIAIAGPKGAFTRSATVTVSPDGILDIECIHDIIENPALKGIQVCGINVPSNSAPSIDVIADQTDTEGDVISLQVNASDPDVGDALTYSATGLPSGLSIDQNGVISGTIAVGAATGSPYSVTVTVEDNGSPVESASEAFQWTVNEPAPVNGAPTIDPIADQTDTEGDVISLQVNASDPDVGDVLTYSATGLPSGLSIDQNGLISGTIAVGAATDPALSVTVTVEDNGSPVESASEAFQWTVNEPVNDVFVVINPEISNVNEGDIFSVTVEIQGNDAEFNSAGAYINFDPSVLQVVGITPGSTLSTTVINTFDNVAGEIDYAAAIFSSTVSGTFDLLTIQFEAVGGPSTGLIFQSGPAPRITSVLDGDSNEFLTGVTNGTVNVTLNPELVISPDLFNEVLEPDQSTTNAFTVSTSDAGALPGDLDVVSDQPWLIPNPANDGYTIDATGLAEGNYSATLTASGTGYDNGLATVELTVTPPPALVITPDVINISVSQGLSESAGFAVTTSNGDPLPGDLAISALGAAPWLTLSPGNDGLTVDASALAEGGYTETIEATGTGFLSGSATINLTVGPPAVPAALVEITPGTGIGGSTFGGSSAFQITNQSTGTVKIVSVSMDLSTGILPDMVFDPTGSGGDATAQCFNANGGAATATGFVPFSSNCVDPFSAPRQGGFDVVSMAFTDFDPNETFSFSTDIDPNSIQGVPGAGDAGAVSGFELIASTITVEFSDGSTLVSNLYEEGSFGGSQALSPTNLPAPSIELENGLTGQILISDPTPNMVITGEPDAYYSLLQMDARLFIASGDPPFNVADETFYANEAMTKVLYNGQFDANGEATVEVTLLQTPGGGATPDGGKNHFVAVQSPTPYAVDQAVSATSNIMVMVQVPCDLVLDILPEDVVDATCADSNGEATVSITGGSGNLSILWDDPLAQTTATATGLDAGTYSVTVSDNDNPGCSATTQVTIVDIPDTTPPVAVCQDITVQLDALGQASILAADIDNGSSDDCGIASLSLDVTAFDCTDLGTNTVTLSVEDGAGNVSTCSATVTVQDIIPPVALCQDITVQLDGTGNASILPADIDNGSSDNCSLASLSLDVDQFDCTNVGTNTVTLTVTDPAGNSDVCTAIVTVVDDLAPDAQCQDITVQLDATGNVSITAADIDNSSSDNCGIASLSLDPTAFDCTNIGPNTVTLTVTDVNGNESTCTSTVTVVDATAPSAVCQNISVSLDVNGEAVITAGDVDGGSTDNCNIASLSIDVNEFDCNDIGPNNVTLSVVDDAGNVSTCVAVVTVVDDLAPVPFQASLPDLFGECAINDFVIPAALDNCANVVFGTPDLPTPITAQGTTVVTWTFADGNGNSTTLTQNVILNDVTDPDVPTLVDLTGECSVTAVPPTTTDNCGATITGTTVDPLTYDTQGSYVIEWTFDDGNGNSILVPQNVIVDDVTPPAVPVLEDLEGECSVSATAPSAIDLCAGEVIGTTTDPLVYNVQGSYVIEWTFDDGNGNSITATQNVIVDDITPPATSALNDLTGECSVTATPPSALDNCEGTIVATTTDPLIYDVQGSYVIEWTFDDGNGNSVNVSQNVIVDDVSEPVISCISPDAVDRFINQANNTYLVAGAEFDPTATDNCTADENIDVSHDAAGISGAIAGAGNASLDGWQLPPGDNIITFTADDLNGNTSTCQITVTVNELALSGNADVNEECGDIDMRVIVVDPVTEDQSVFYTTVAANGDFNLSLPGIVPGQYDVYVKPDRYLQQLYDLNISGNANFDILGLRLGDIAGNDEMGFEGDGFKDNFINGLDLSVPIAIYFSEEGDPDFNPASDLNCDGIVNGLDLSLIIFYYLQGGESPE